MNRENYRSTEVKWPQKSPWKMGMNGDVNLEDDNKLVNINKEDTKWSSTVHRTVGLAYRTVLNVWEVFPANYDVHRFGFSVCKEQLKPAHGET